MTAPQLLQRAAEHMADRAKTYDSPEGERSMGRTVTAFNAITGRDLTEAEGWLLMQILKDVRDRQRRDKGHRDSLEDCIAYAALKAEARIAEFGQPFADVVRPVIVSAPSVLEAKACLCGLLAGQCLRRQVPG